ncbi:octopamine receptor 1-like [Orbicella faveolata]|uniref:octopamine receptor 1-like n=1 Tax=Orbicella faveolata TaxID=48498 RepID=UPI0009E5AC6F|nr:octopamine receptor 1-like [Orbicella faveolata]XP_020618799.1 octopamine receptor 1-like [Orbicella faveolata]XP_020618800.1 octopamine receptor 1-like [Orbicella faveolata]
MVKNGSTNSTVDLSNIEATFLASVNVVFSLCGIIGNVLVLIVIARNRQLHTVTNVFISSLALADLLVCIVAQPMNAVFLYGLPPNPVYGMTRKTFSFVSMLASISNLAVLTVDRYIAIVTPMQYQLKANFKRASILLCLIWVISLGLGIPSGIIQSVQRITKYYTLALVVIIVPIYIRIYLIARGQERVIARQAEHIEKDSKKKRDRENIAAKTIGSVLAVFIFCWLPLIVIPMIFRYSAANRVVMRALKWAQTVALCSSAVNPVIYSLKTQIFKQEVKKVLRSTLRRNSWEDKPMALV